MLTIKKKKKNKCGLVFKNKKRYDWNFDDSGLLHFISFRLFFEKLPSCTLQNDRYICCNTFEKFNMCGACVC